MKVYDLLKNESKIGQFVRFIIVGGIAAGILYVVYVGLIYIGLLRTISYTIAYGISFIFNFIASNYFTFNSTPNTKKGFKFVGAHIFNYLFQIALLNFFIKYGIADTVAPILVLVIAIPINFIFVNIALKDNNIRP